jgi:hypothetical protein
MQQTFENHPKALADSDDKCLALIVPDIGQTRFTLH